MPESEDPNNPSGWSAGDIGHGILDIAGLVPVIGEGADVANAAWYAAEGKYLDAGLSLISVIPIVGDIIGKGGKLAKKLGPNIANQIIKAIKNLDIPKFLNKFKSNPKLAPYIGKITDALKKWQDGITKNFNKADASKGTAKCSNATTTKSLKADVKKIKSKLTAGQVKIYNKIKTQVKQLDAAAAKDSALFYAGTVTREEAGKIVVKKSYEVVDEILGRAGSLKTSLNETELGKYLMNPETQKMLKQLPPDAVDNIWLESSKKYAQSVKGDIEFIGDISSITKEKIFYRIEIDTLLNNPKVSESSKALIRQIKETLDAKFAGG